MRREGLILKKALKNMLKEPAFSGGVIVLEKPG